MLIRSLACSRNTNTCMHECVSYSDGLGLPFSPRCFSSIKVFDRPLGVLTVSFCRFSYVISQFSFVSWLKFPLCPYLRGGRLFASVLMQFSALQCLHLVKMNHMVGPSISSYYITCFEIVPIVIHIIVLKECLVMKPENIQNT